MVAEKRKTALVTGGSDGIGKELAKLFATDGYNLVLVGRDREKLQKIEDEFEERYSIAVKPVVADLSHPEAAQQVHHILEKSGIMVDALVNNAGMGHYGKFEKTSPAIEIKMIRVNIMALVQLTKLVLPHMIEQKKGKILNVASTAAFAPGEKNAVYNASKAFVLSFSKAVGKELQGTGVQVTALCPGMTDTRFHRRAGTPLSEEMEERLMDAETVARAGYRGLLQGKPVVIPGSRNRLAAFLGKLFHF